MQHPELVNLAESLTEEERNEIASKVVEDYETDEQSRAEWLDMHAKWISLYYQKDRPLNPPWDGSSAESMPLLAEACNQFHARAFPAFFPNRNIIKAVPTGNIDPDSEARAKRVGKHMSWQLLVKDKTYKRNKDSLLLAVPLHGSYFTKTYFDPLRKSGNVVKNVRPVDLVVPYGTGPRQIEDIDRKTEIIPMSVNDSRIYKKAGFFVDEAVPYTGAHTTAVDEVTDENEGLEKPTIPEDGSSPCRILEQHRLWDLDGDGIAEPYICTVDHESRKLLRMSIRYEVDEQGNPTNDKRPVEYYTHYVFLPNPDGFYGLGFGHLVGPLNTAVNKMLRQTLDAGTLANTASGFVNDTLPLNGDTIQMNLGSFEKIRFDGKIADNIHQLKFPEPSPSIINAISALMQRSDRLATVTEALTGQTQKVLQPTALMALIEQGLTFFSTVYERLWCAWESELDKVYRLNSLYLEETEYTDVLDLNGPQQLPISKLDYAPDLQVSPIADPKMATEQQKLAKGQAEFSFLSQNPICVNNKVAFYKASLKYAEVIGIENPEEVLPPPEVKQEQRVDDQKEENFGALLPIPDVPPVYPDQNHLEHLKEIDAFLADQYGQLLTKEGKDMLMKHRQMHIAFLYAVTETTMMDEAVDDQIRSRTMASQPGDAMVPSGVGEAQPADMAGGDGLGPI